MVWIWDEAKGRANRRKHGVSFETAVRVFDDPLMLSRPDPHPYGDRWQTLGLVGKVLLFVVHTEPVFLPSLGTEGGRLISARRATSFERRDYEEGHF